MKACFLFALLVSNEQTSEASINTFFIYVSENALTRWHDATPKWHRAPAYFVVLEQEQQ